MKAVVAILAVVVVGVTGWIYQHPRPEPNRSAADPSTTRTGRASSIGSYPSLQLQLDTYLRQVKPLNGRADAGMSRALRTLDSLPRQPIDPSAYTAPASACWRASMLFDALTLGVQAATPPLGLRAADISLAETFRDEADTLRRLGSPTMASSVAQRSAAIGELHQAMRRTLHWKAAVIRFAIAHRLAYPSWVRSRGHRYSRH